MWFMAPGSTDKTIYVQLRDSTTGLAKTGLVYNSAGASCYYTRELAAAASIPLATQTVTGSHSDGGFVEVDATNAKGLYRLDLSDAVVAAGVNFVIVSIEFDGIIEESVLIQLNLSSLTDLEDQVLDALLSGHTDAGSVGERIGRIPNAAAGGAGGVPTVDAANRVAGIQGTINTLDSVFTTQMTESYAALGTAPTLTQVLLWVQQLLTELVIAGTTGSIKKLDGSTEAGTLTFNDPTNPTSRTRGT
jgi:hypothetical protein